MHNRKIRSEEVWDLLNLPTKIEEIEQLLHNKILPGLKIDYISFLLDENLGGSRILKEDLIENRKSKIGLSINPFVLFDIFHTAILFNDATFKQYIQDVTEIITSETQMPKYIYPYYLNVVQGVAENNGNRIKKIILSRDKKHPEKRLQQRDIVIKLLENFKKNQRVSVGVIIDDQRIIPIPDTLITAFFDRVTNKHLQKMEFFFIYNIKKENLIEETLLEVEGILV